MMNPILKWVLIIGGIIVFFALVIGAYFVFIKPSSAPPSPDPDGTPSPDPEPTGDPCTATQIKKKCENKCINKLLLPFIGFTSYHTCVRECKSTPPEEFKIC